MAAINTSEQIIHVVVIIYDDDGFDESYECMYLLSACAYLSEHWPPRILRSMNMISLLVSNSNLTCVRFSMGVPCEIRQGVIMVGIEAVTRDTTFTENAS